MDTSENPNPTVTTFGVRGYLDSHTSDAFEARLFAAISGGARNIILDLQELDYISSAGLRVVLKANHFLKKVKGRILLCSMQDYVKEVFELARFDSFLTIVPTLEEALQAFKKPSCPE